MRIDRRRFLAYGTAACGGLIGAALGAPIAGYLLSPLYERRDPVVERLVGDISSIPEGRPTRFVVEFPENAWNASIARAHTVYVVRLNGRLLALSNVCTHMQCDVHWQPDLGQFLCPCHGGLYDISGRNVGGPPPKPLPEYRHRLDGSRLYVSNVLAEDI